MAASPSFVQRATNRRRRVRHKIQTPAYATFTNESQGAMLDLHEILNVSEEGVAIQCPIPLEVGKRINLCLDLAECPDHIYTTGQVIWSNPDGRAGLRFAELPPFSVFRLREWLFLNAVAAVANADDASGAASPQLEHVPPRPSYTDMLAAVTAIQREVEVLGGDFPAALQLIAARTQTLIKASGAAIALAGGDPEFMVCRATAGPDAPPVGARLQVGAGFSGECVRAGRLMRCDDTEDDSRVDPESCRALGIRSLIAVPVRVGEKSVGILEAFSTRPNAFSDSQSRVLQRLAETVLTALNRAARAENLPPLEPPPATDFAPTSGSVLFASQPEDKTTAAKSSGGISLPKTHLILLIVAAAVIFMVLGYYSAPLIESKLHERGRGQLPTVLASSQEPIQAPKPANSVPGTPTVETASLDQLLQLAQQGDAAAQNALGLRYATGDGVTQSEPEAVRWFTKSAEQGNIAAQSKLGAVYFRGRDIPQNFNQAYFWMALARANGDENSKVLAPLVAAHLTHEQINAIELDASRWLQQHAPSAKPQAAH